jgi:hypothetical protein
LSETIQYIRNPKDEIGVKMNKIELFIKYFRNNRIEDYNLILKLALENNYQLISLRDYILRNFDKSKKIIILRHDVDHISDGTQMMFEIEKRYNSKASYYFRNSTAEYKLINKIEKYGSEASLHFETIADFVKENKIKNKKELFNTNFKEKCLERLNINIGKFRKEFNVPCLTIASHGEYENSLVETPNNYLTENIASYELLKIKLEAYNKEFIDKVNCYISDTVLEINNGYRYGVTPPEAIQKGYKIILFLSHPNHWHYSKYKQLKKMVKMIVQEPITEDKTFTRS